MSFPTKLPVATSDMDEAESREDGDNQSVSTQEQDKEEQIPNSDSHENMEENLETQLNTVWNAMTAPLSSVLDSVYQFADAMYNDNKSDTEMEEGGGQKQSEEPGSATGIATDIGSDIGMEHEGKESISLESSESLFADESVIESNGKDSKENDVENVLDELEENNAEIGKIVEEFVHVSEELLVSNEKQTKASERRTGQEIQREMEQEMEHEIEEEMYIAENRTVCFPLTRQFMRLCLATMFRSETGHDGRDSRGHINAFEDYHARESM